MTAAGVGPAEPAVRRARQAVAGAFAAQGFGFASVLTRLPEFKDRWGVGDLAVTVLVFVVAVLAGAGSGVAAVSAARAGSAVTLRRGLLVAAVALAGVGLAPAFAVFVVALCAYGVALGAIDAGTNMQAVALEDRYGRSILTSFHAAWSLGGIAGALVTAATSALGWSLPVALAPLAVVPAVAAAGRFLPHTADAQPIDAADAAVDAAAEIPWRALGVLGAALVLFYVADSAASSWSSIYLHDALHAASGLVPLGYGAYQATSLVSRLAGDHVVRRRGATGVVRTAALVAAVGLALVVLAPTGLVAIAGFAVLGAGLAVVAPLSFAAAGRLAGSGDRRRIDALVARLNQFNYLGFVLGGVLTGLVSSAGSLRWGFVVPLVGVLLIVPIAPAFATRREGRPELSARSRGPRADPAG